MDLEKMRRLTQNMENVNEGTNTSGISEDEAADLNRRGNQEYDKQNYEVAFKFWLKSAEGGNMYGMYNIADAYQKGEGVAQDHSAAFKWYKRAAELGEIKSMFEVGAYYYRGEYVEEDIFKSFAWCKKAAENGIINAMNWVGEFYRDGKGIQKNDEEALRWFEKSANGGNMYALVNVGMMYAEEKRLHSERAVSLIEDAIKKSKETNDSDLMAYAASSMTKVARLFNGYYKRSGQPVWHAKYLDCLLKAEEAGNEEAARERQHEIDTCFITTAVCDNFGKSDDCYELTAFRNFRDIWLINQPDGKSLIDEYYKIAPKIVEKINSLANSAEIYKNIWSDYLQACLKFIEVGENQKCKKIYVGMVNTLKDKFLK